MLAMIWMTTQYHTKYSGIFVIIELENILLGVEYKSFIFFLLLFLVDQEQKMGKICSLLQVSF